MPGDLNLKKSWHPGLVKNQTKIWEKEQETIKEYQKIKEREAEIQKEKEYMALLHIQYPNGIPSNKLNPMSWMYEGNGISQNKKEEISEEFKNGRKKIEDIISGKQVTRKQDKSRLDLVLGGDVIREKDLDRQYRDDPLSVIRRGQIEKYEKMKRSSDEKKHDSERSPERDERRQYRSSRYDDDSRRRDEREARSGSSRYGDSRHRSERSTRYDSGYRSISKDYKSEDYHRYGGRDPREYRSIPKDYRQEDYQKSGDPRDYRSIPKEHRSENYHRRSEKDPKDSKDRNDREKSPGPRYRTSERSSKTT